MTAMSFDELLPLIFIGLMGVSLLVYVVSDGYDLGVGMRGAPRRRRAAGRTLPAGYNEGRQLEAARDRKRTTSSI